MFSLLHDFYPVSILIQIGPLAIHWYGFLMVLAGLAGLFVALKLAKYYQIGKSIIYDLLIYWAVGAVIGSRVYYVIYAWEFYRNNLADIFKIWQGGLAVHGVMIGGFAAALVFCQLKKLNFGLMLDITSTSLVASQIIGRAGNYFNQEIFGKPTDLAWAIPIELINRPAGFENFNYFHPVFLYEMMGNAIILCALLSLHFFRLKRKSSRVGNIFIIYLILYSVLRFFLEFLRLDYSPVVFGIRWAQVFSAAIIILSAGLLVYSFRRIWLKSFERK